METAIIIARCSTNENKQDVTRQTTELTEKYKNQFKIEKVFAYYKSGTKNQDNNKEMLEFAEANKIQHIIVSEVSRISRKVIDVLQFVEYANTKKINVIIDNYNMFTLLPNKKINTMTQTMLQIGASFASMELSLTKERLDSGRKKYIKEGGRLGRNSGTIESKEQFLEKHKDVIKHLKQGQSVRNTMKLADASSGTVQKVKKLLLL